MSRNKQRRLRDPAMRRQRKAAKTRHKRAVTKQEKFAWVMSLPNPHTTMPAPLHIGLHFSRPVINHRGKIFAPSRWFTRKQQRADDDLALAG